MPEMEKGRPPENKRSRKPAHPVKREINQEMKTFAESTMNELLGWYGYDKVELRDNEATEIRNYPNRERRQQHVSVLKENSVPKPKSLNSKVSPSALAMRSGERESSSVPTSSSFPSSSSLTSPKEHKSAPVIVPLIKPSAVEDVQNVQIVCVWCQKEGVKRYSLCMGTELKSFCSEKCFAACRRAYFKRNKARDEDLNGGEQSPQHTHADDSPRLVMKMNSSGARVCDWCKHVRHTKEYLDFGAGAERLQFCSSKCLNQYKMDVFYREARAALISSSPGPGRPTQDGRTESNGGGQNQKLLTPESWNNGAAVVRGRTRSPKGPMPRTVSPSEASSSSSKAPVSGLRHLERHVLPPLPPPEVANHHSVPPPRPPMEHHQHHQAIPQIPLPFIRPPLHAQGLTSPIANPHRCHPGPPSSPINRSTPHSPHHPHLQPPSASSMNPPRMHPYPGAYFPGLHSPPMMGPRGPVPMPSMMNFGRWPSLGPFFPQPMVLVPYPIIVPIPVPIPIPIPIPMPPKASPSDPLGTSPSGVIQPVPDGMERRCSSGVKLPSPGSSVQSRLSRTTNQGLPSPSDHPKRDITDWVKSERQAPSPMSTPHSAASSPRACYDASPSSTSVIEALIDFKLGQQQQPERQLIHRVLQRTPVKLELNLHGMVDLSGKRESRAGQSTRVLDTRVDHHNHHHDIIKPTPPPSQAQTHNPPRTLHQRPEGDAAALPVMPPPPPPRCPQISLTERLRHHPPTLLPAQTPPSPRERPRSLALTLSSASWRQSKRTAAPMARSRGGTRASSLPSPLANQRSPRPVATLRTPTSSMRTTPMPCPPPPLPLPGRAVSQLPPTPHSFCPSSGTRAPSGAHQVWLDLGTWSLLRRDGASESEIRTSRRGSGTRSSALPSYGHHQNQRPLSNPFLSQSVSHQGDWPRPSSDHEVPIKEAVQWGTQPKIWTSSIFTASLDFRDTSFFDLCHTP